MTRPKKKQQKKKKNLDAATRVRYRRTGWPASYRSAALLARQLKRPVLEALLREEAYTLHRPVTYKFRRRRILAGGPFDQFQCDLVDVSAYKKANNGIKFLLCCVDVFSKYAWVRTLKNKTMKSVATAFADVLEETRPRKPLYVQTDKGTEFMGKAFFDLLKKNSIQFFTTENEDIKASIVE